MRCKTEVFVLTNTSILAQEFDTNSFGKTIREHIKNKFNINLSVKSVYNILRKNNITNKKVYRKINKLSIDEFNKKKKIMSDKITEVGQNNVISIDDKNQNL